MARVRSRFRSCVRSWIRWHIAAESVPAEVVDPFPFCSTAFIDRLEVL